MNDSNERFEELSRSLMETVATCSIRVKHPQHTISAWIASSGTLEVHMCSGNPAEERK